MKKKRIKSFFKKDEKKIKKLLTIKIPCGTITALSNERTVNCNLKIEQKGKSECVLVGDRDITKLRK